VQEQEGQKQIKQWQREAPSSLPSLENRFPYSPSILSGKAPWIIPGPQSIHSAETDPSLFKEPPTKSTKPPEKLEMLYRIELKPKEVPRSLMSNRFPARGHALLFRRGCESTGLLRERASGLLPSGAAPARVVPPPHAMATPHLASRECILIAARTSTGLQLNICNSECISIATRITVRLQYQVEALSICNS
jgi:hypothetical protein